MALTLTPNFYETGKEFFNAYSSSDAFYQMLIDEHRDLTEEQSELFNAKLILLLANHIGDLALLKKALEAARSTV